MERIFGSTPVLNIIFLLLAILGIVLAVVSINLSRRIKRPVFNSRSFNLINSKSFNIPNLRIQVLDKDIETLTLTQIAFWNMGKDIINHSDVAPLAPISISVLNGNRIINAEIKYASKETNNFSLITKDGFKEVEIGFDYIAMDEGVVVNLYHTGLSSTDVKLTGVIKGVNKIENFNFISNYHTGAIVMKLLYKYLGGEKSKVWGVCLIIILFPFWVFLLFSEMLFTKSYRYKLVNKHFYLSD